MTPMDLNLPALEMQTLFDALPDVVFFIKDGEGRYLIGNPQGTISPSLWGLPVVTSLAMTAGTSIVGDFRECILWDRMSIQVTSTNAHADYFMRNLIQFRAELRAGFGCRYPKALVKVSHA